MKNRPSVLQLNKKYHADFFLGVFYGDKCPCIDNYRGIMRIINKIRKDGMICILTGDTWHIFYKE